MNFSLIVPIPNVSNTGNILMPTKIHIHGSAQSQFKYTFSIYTEIGLNMHNITDLYTTLVGTEPDCDKRFTEPIEAHLEMLFKESTTTKIINKTVNLSL